MGIYPKVCGLISEDGELSLELLEAVSGGANVKKFVGTVLVSSTIATGYAVTGRPIKAIAAAGIGMIVASCYL